jgi:hypothetical protein
MSRNLPFSLSDFVSAIKQMMETFFIAHLLDNDMMSKYRDHMAVVEQQK